MYASHGQIEMNCTPISYQCNILLLAEHIRAPNLFGRWSYFAELLPDPLHDPTLSSDSFRKPHQLLWNY